MSEGGKGCQPEWLGMPAQLVGRFDRDPLAIALDLVRPCMVEEIGWQFEIADDGQLGVVAVAVGLWAVIVYVFPPSTKSPASVEAACGGVAIGGNVGQSKITAGNPISSDCSRKSKYATATYEIWTGSSFLHDDLGARRCDFRFLCPDFG
jgi:hypothetical protein